jgi:hypothetical protein
MKREVVRARPAAPAVTVSVRGEKRVEAEYYERVLANGHKWGFPEPKATPYTPPPPAKPEAPEPRVPWWKNFCDPRWLLSVRPVLGLRRAALKRGFALRALALRAGAAAGRTRAAVRSLRHQLRPGCAHVGCAALWASHVRVATRALTPVALALPAAAGAATAHPAAAGAAQEGAGAVPCAGLRGRVGRQKRRAVAAQGG